LPSDIVDAATRSRMMAGIRGKNTRPEIAMRRALHRQGFRYRLHARDLPGKPDMVLPRWQAAILVHGCFWHGHDCSLFRWPATREAFWREKIEGNRQRDIAVRTALRDINWRVLTIWECALKGRARIGIEAAAQNAAAWLRGGERAGEIRGLDDANG
jgi:DNA mismatch endonuclease, patch repair protein